MELFNVCVYIKMVDYYRILIFFIVNFVKLYLMYINKIRNYYKEYFV